MKKLAAVVLSAVFAFFAFGANTFDGTWKLDVKKSDFSKTPDGAPREVTLTLRENGWTYASTDANGKKENIVFDNRAKGDDKISIKYEPTTNPSVSDIRFSQKDSGKEFMRAICTLLPDGNTLVIYGSGVSPDSKQWSDVSYYTRVK